MNRSLSRVIFTAWSLSMACVAAHLGGEASHGADWPQFLGPNRDGVSSEKGLNWDWKSPPQVLWKIPLGSGYSSLAIVGNRIYTTAKRGNRDIAVCLDMDGKEVWTCDGAPTYIDKQKQGAGPRSTPVFHKDRLYCQFANGDLVCVSADGKRLWEANIFKDTGAASQVGEFYYWGVSQSPLVEGDLVVVQPGGNKGNSVAAFHRETGKRIWMAGDDPLGYASPIAITAAGRRALIVPTGRSVLGIDPAGGAVLFRYAFGNEFNATGATPVWRDDALFVSAAYGAGSAVLELVPGPDKWEVRERWKNKKSLQNLFATSIVQDGHIYGSHGDLSAFQLRCLDVKTGKIVWEERATERYSLLAADGHLLFWGERGNLTALKATPSAYTVVGELPKLLTYKSWAMPALAGGRLFVRDEKHVLCLDLRRK